MSGIWIFILYVPIVIDNQILKWDNVEFVPFDDHLLEYGDYSDYLMGDCDGQNCSTCCNYDYIDTVSDFSQDGR